MPITDLVPDAEVAMREWLLSEPEVTALLSTRIATRLPEDPVFPFLTLFVVGGEFAVGEAPLYEAFVQFDAFGARGGRHPDYASASAVIRTVAYLCDQMSYVQTTEAHIYGCEILQMPIRMEEPDTEWARYELTVMAQMRSNT